MPSIYKEVALAPTRHSIITRFAWRTCCALAALLVPAVARAQQPPAGLPDTLPTVTLQQALELARRVSPALASGEANVRAARASRLASTGEYLPSLGVASSAGRGTAVQGANAVTNGVPVASAMRPLDDVYGSGISAAIPLFTGGRRGADRRSANAQQTAATAGMTSAEFDVRLATKQAYFDVLRAGELVEVATARVTEGEEAMRDAERHLRAGTSTRSDVLRARVTLANARDALLTAQAARTAAQYALGRTIGNDGAVRAEPVDDTDSLSLTISRDSLAAMAVRAAPAARAANASAQFADAAIGSARAQYLPSVLASGGYGWLEQRSVTSHPVSGWTMQVGVSYPLFNNFQREASVMRAEAQASAAHVAARDTERGVRADAVRAYDQVRVTSERIGLAREAVTAATEDLRVQQARYRAGASTFLDEITSEANLTQARTALVQARYDHQIARATLERVLGREL